MRGEIEKRERNRHRTGAWRAMGNDGELQGEGTEGTEGTEGD